MSPLEAQTTVVSVLVVLGAAIKHAVPSAGINRWIPLILLALGTPLYAALLQAWTVADLAQGLLAAASATGLHQALKQSTGTNL